MKLKERIVKDLARCGSGILGSGELDRAYGQTHHLRSNLGDHSLRVAEASLVLCYMLRGIGIGTDIPAVVTGALCHDLGMLGREEKYASRSELERRHPADSAALAQELAGGISEKTSDIIERHMWPTPGSKAPNSLEGVIVSLADKYAAVTDLLLGSRKERK